MKTTAVICNTFEDFKRWAIIRNIRPLKENKSRFVDSDEEYIPIILSNRVDMEIDKLRGIHIQDIEDISWHVWEFRNSKEQLLAMAQSRIRE